MEIRSEKVIANLLNLMAKADLNQRQLALKADIAPEYLNKIMKGKRGLGMAIATKLAKALSCSVDDIFLEKQQEAPPPTVRKLLQVMTEMQKEIDRLMPSADLVGGSPTQTIALMHKHIKELTAEIDEIKQSPFFQAWQSAKPSQRSVALKILAAPSPDDLRRALAQLDRTRKKQ